MLQFCPRFFANRSHNYRNLLLFETLKNLIIQNRGMYKSTKKNCVTFSLPPSPLCLKSQTLLPPALRN